MANKIEVTKLDGKFTKVTVNGKPVQKSQVNALNVAQETDFWHEYPEGEYTGVNIMSGCTVPLTAFEKTVYHWITAWYMRYSSGVMPTAVLHFDNMRYLFLALNSEAYYDLVD